MSTQRTRVPTRDADAVRARVARVNLVYLDDGAAVRVEAVERGKVGLVPIHHDLHQVLEAVLEEANEKRGLGHDNSGRHCNKTRARQAASIIVCPRPNGTQAQLIEEQHTWLASP